MRSPIIGPLLTIIGLATVVVLVLVLFSGLGMRDELSTARAEISSLREEVAALDAPMTDDDLVQRLDELESGIRDWLIATGADGFDPSDGDGGDGQTDPGAGGDDVEARLDEIIDRLEALDARIDEICGNVPVC